MISQEARVVRCLERREEEEDKTGEGNEIGREEQRMLTLSNFGEMYWTYNLSQNCAPH